MSRNKFFFFLVDISLSFRLSLSFLFFGFRSVLVLYAADGTSLLEHKT